MKRFWPLGFLGILGFFGIHFLSQGKWTAALMILCFGFFAFFLPAIPKK